MLGKFLSLVVWLHCICPKLLYNQSQSDANMSRMCMFLKNNVNKTSASRSRLGRMMRALACYQCGPRSAPTTQHHSFFRNSTPYPDQLFFHADTLSVSKSNIRSLKKHLLKSLPSFNFCSGIPG